MDYKLQKPTSYYNRLKYTVSILCPQKGNMGDHFRIIADAIENGDDRSYATCFWAMLAATLGGDCSTDKRGLDLFISRGEQAMGMYLSWARRSAAEMDRIAAFLKQNTTVDIGNSVDFYLEEAAGCLDDDDDDDSSVEDAGPIDPFS